LHVYGINIFSSNDLRLQLPLPHYLQYGLIKDE
jgi:hypothetical protein